MLLLYKLTILSIVTTKLAHASVKTNESFEDNSDVSTSNHPRRKTSFKFSPGNGGRLSLMNSRIQRRPRRKDLDSDQLLDILGNFYDPHWMSIEEPLAISNKDPDLDSLYVVKRDNWQFTNLVKQLHMLNLSTELADLGGQDRSLIKMFEQWLLKKSHCPVKYSWEDIGNLFWPRYIKRGECTSVPGTCSWPPGMHCVPSGTTSFHVLRWQCKIPRGTKAKRKNLKNPKDQLKTKEWSKKIQEGDQHINLRCSWIRVPYPIISDCICTC